jgi:hypothetical protein
VSPTHSAPDLSESTTVSRGLPSLRFVKSSVALRHTPYSPPSSLNSLTVAMPSYTYKSTLMGRHIRLLQIEPGSGDTGLKCRLFPAPLDSSSYYNALSYAWGDPTDTRLIICNGKELKVIQNLYLALWHLRKRGDFVPIWADAVCMYSYRTATKCCRNLKFRPQFCEGFGFASHCLDSNPQKPCSGSGGPFGSRLQLPTAPPNTFQLSLLPGSFALA